MRKFYHLSYPAPPQRETRRIHELRDDGVMVEIMPHLCRTHLYAGKILSTAVPSEDPEPELGPDDLLVLTTRPPLDDATEVAPRRSLVRGAGSLEVRVLEKRVRRYFEACHRGGVVLNPEVSQRLVRTNRKSIQFRVNLATEYACYRKISEHESTGDEERLTAGFVLRAPAGDGCPEVLAVFGMNGPASLLFAHLVRVRLSHLLDGPGLSIVLLLTEPIPPNPGSLRSVEHLRYEIILDRCRLAELEG